MNTQNTNESVVDNRILKRELSKHINNKYGDDKNNVTLKEIKWSKSNTATINITRGGFVSTNLIVPIQYGKEFLQYHIDYINSAEENYKNSTDCQRQGKLINSVKEELREFFQEKINDIFPISDYSISFQHDCIVYKLNNHRIETKFMGGEAIISNENLGTQTHIQTGHSNGKEQKLFQSIINILFHKHQQMFKMFYFRYFTQVENLKTLSKKEPEDVEFIKPQVRNWIENYDGKPYTLHLNNFGKWQRQIRIVRKTIHKFELQMMVKHSHKDVTFFNYKKIYPKVVKDNFIVDDTYNLLKSYM